MNRQFILSILFGMLLLYFVAELSAQVSVNADDSPPDPSAGLDVKFTNKGLLPPRMTHAQMDSIATPADGLIIYCTNCSSTGGGAMAMFKSGTWFAFVPTCILPLLPTAAIHPHTPTQITWSWSPVSDATGYKWSATNNYADATDMGTATSKTDTGLTCNTLYTRYIWAYNACGNSTALTLTQATSPCVFTCGSSITVNHTADSVAPVNKTVVYGTVTNIPGEPSKCWITSNLGADHQAIAVDDATEASAGWYWQFNRKQGYKNIGYMLTPPWTITIINETSDWLSSNDPCNIELGSTWRIPTYTEWYNVSLTGGWNNWTILWNSMLKLHAAGYLYDGNGMINGRGIYGDYWSSTQYDSTLSWIQFFNNSSSYQNSSTKACGFSVRCIKE